MLLCSEWKTENSQYARVLELEYIQVLETWAERIESSNLSSGIRGVIMDLLDKLPLTQTAGSIPERLAI